MPKENAADEGRLILVVDDQQAIHAVLVPLLRRQGYRTAEAYDGVEALAKVHEDPPDLVIADMHMPNMNGRELCQAIKADPRTAVIPILMLTAMSQLEHKVAGLDSGADDYVSKPFQRAELLARVRSMLRLKTLHDHLTSAEDVIFTLARAVEAKDKYTQGHVERVSALSVRLGQAMGLPPEDIESLERGGILHDIGKIGVPDAVLNKPGPLTPEEFAIIKEHPVTGETICRKLKLLKPVLPIIRHHHEKLDGSGYPDGLRDDEIETTARVTAVSDTYDALTSDRSYRKGMSPERALSILDEEVDKNWWDPDVVHLLRERIESADPARCEDTRAGNAPVAAATA